MKDTLALDPGKLYAVAPSPFFASPVGPGAPQGSGADGGAMVTLSVTADTQVPARRVALPLWFAAEFCAFRDVASLPADPPEGTAFVYEQEAIDPVPRMLITTERSLHAMKRVGGLRCTRPTSILPVNQSATSEERAAFATASVALIFRTLGTVPRGVVPSLVLEHVVAPYAAKVRCTMEQGMLGVTELAQTQAVTLPFGSGATPNLKKLTLSPDPSSYVSLVYEGPLPPSITSLVLGPEAFSVDNLNTAPLLTSLVITSKCWHGRVPGAPMPTVVRLTLPYLGVSGNEYHNDPVLKRITEAFPNVKSLRVLSLCWHGTFTGRTFWPRLTELDANVKVVISARWARRGWHRLTFRSDESKDEWSVSGRGEHAIILPELRHLAFMFPVMEISVLEAPALQTLYLTATGHSSWNGRGSVPGLFTNAPDLQHVSIDVPPTESHDARVRALVHDIAAKIGPSLRFVTCRPGRVWGLSPEMTWAEGAVVPPHLVMREDGEATSPEPPRMCQCLLAP